MSTAAERLARHIWAEAAGRPVRAMEGVAAVALRRPPAGVGGDAPAEGDATLAACRRIAARALAGLLPDPTGGADRFHPAETLPRWALGQVPSAECGGLVFYRTGAG
jgi:spore germination cell wall hydrolase CwlJ-like protein